MNERVLTLRGKLPVILVCPHGPDDTNTAVITRTAAQNLDCYAVINQGFQRSNTVDVCKDLADCNRINHIKQDVIYEEYLRPIVRFRDKIKLKSYQNSMLNVARSDGPLVHIFHIHGCGNHVHKEAGENVAVVIGYGLGDQKDSLSCPSLNVSQFIHAYKRFCNYGIYEGKRGGRYTGRDSNNVNQYFRKHDDDENVNSLQLEFPLTWRWSTEQAQDTGRMLSHVITEYLKMVQNNTYVALTSKFI